jgi:WD40 repeat protein
VRDLLSAKNASLLVSCSLDRTIKVWNRSSGLLLKTLNGHLNRISRIIMTSQTSSHGFILVSCSSDLTLRTWDLIKGQELKRINTTFDGEMLSLVVLNQSSIASGSTNWQIQVWNVQEGVELRQLTGHSGQVNWLELLQNGHLASASSDKTIRIWNLESDVDSLIMTFFAHTSSTNCLALLSDGNLASGSHDESIKIWHFKTGSNQMSKFPFYISFFHS